MNLSTSPSKEGVHIVVISIAMLLTIMAFAAFNYTNDRWGIFNKDQRFFVDSILPNRFFLKTQHIIDNNQKYDCFIFGSSRVDVLNAEKLGQRCHNFTHSLATPRDHLTAINLFLQHNVPIKKVFIGVDDASYIADPAINRHQHMRRPPPNGFIEHLKFYSPYIFHFPQYIDFEILNGHRLKRDYSWHVIDPNSHQTELQEKSDTIVADLEKHNELMNLLGPTLWGVDQHIEPAIADLSAIIELGSRYGFETIFFFNPLHYKTYLKLNHTDLSAFRRRLSELTHFADFSGLNQYTTNNQYWYETSHFTTQVGKLITSYLADKSPQTVPFGQYVSNHHIDRLNHLKMTQDIAHLLEQDLFKGVTYLPTTMGDFLDRHHQKKILFSYRQGQLAKLDLIGLSLQGSTLFSNVIDPQIIATAGCLDTEKAYIIKIDADFRAPKQLVVFSADDRMPFHAERSDNTLVKKGHNQLYFLLRDVGCNAKLRIDPFPSRGMFNLNAITITELQSSL